MKFKLFSKNGKLLPLDQATVSVFNIEYAYGFGVYENVRVQDHLPYFLGDHVDRLLISAEAIGLKHLFAKETLQRSVTELINAIEESTYNIKILLIGAREPSAVEVFILPLAPLFPDRKLYKKGATAMTIPYERFLPKAKTLNMLPSYYYYTQAKAKGYYDVLFVDKDNNILEGSRTNFFVIKNRTIFTAPTGKVLEGVTKKYVLQVAREHGFEIQEQDIPLKNLGEFDGAFLTSTSSKIVPITSVIPSEARADEESLAQSSIEFATITPTIKELMRLFDEFLDEYRKQKTTYTLLSTIK